MAFCAINPLELALRAMGASSGAVSMLKGYSDLGRDDLYRTLELFEVGLVFQGGNSFAELLDFLFLGERENAL
jgi:hypothetical protein